MSYDGGKGGAGVWQWIINQMPPHTHYIDLFLGNSAVMRRKRPAEFSIGIERNGYVIAEHWRDHGIPGAVIRHGDAISFLDEAESELDAGTFLYADPPYLLETRSSQRQLYAFEFAERVDHLALLSRLKALPCMVAVSGYWSELYAQELEGWRTSTFWTVDRAGNRKQEWLWMNYSAPLELHDYRYLGKDFRERERIKRKKQRWTARLRTMPDLERYALMEAIGALRSSTSPDRAWEVRIAASDDTDEERSTIARTDDAYRCVSSEAARPAAIVENDGAGQLASAQLTMLEQEEVMND